MEIYFKTRKLQKLCSKRLIADKELGVKRAGKLRQRLMELRAADTLSDISRLPPARCHELTGDRRGQLSVDLVHPYRLIFMPSDDPRPKKPDGGLDWERVTAITIVEIVDTH